MFMRGKERFYSSALEQKVSDNGIGRKFQSPESKLQIPKSSDYIFIRK